MGVAGGMLLAELVEVLAGLDKLDQRDAASR
jgi:hypothetical protein